MNIVASLRLYHSQNSGGFNIASGSVLNRCTLSCATFSGLRLFLKACLTQVGNLKQDIATFRDGCNSWLMQGLFATFFDCTKRPLRHEVWALFVTPPLENKGRTWKKVLSDFVEIAFRFIESRRTVRDAEKRHMAEKEHLIPQILTSPQPSPKGEGVVSFVCFAIRSCWEKGHKIHNVTTD